MAELKDILQVIDNAPKAFEKKLPAVEKKIFGEISILLKELKTNQKGGITPSLENLNLLTAIKSKLGKIVVSSEYANVVQDFVKNIPTISNFQTTTNQIDSEGKKIISANAKMQIDSTLESLIGGGYKQSVVNEIYDILKTNIISGGSYADMTEQLRSKIVSDSEGAGLIQKYAKTYVQDSLGVFAGEGNKIVAEKLNSEWFAYEGSNLTTTREFCEHLTEKRWVHKSEIPELLKGKIDDYQCEIYEKTGLPKGMKEDTTPENFIVFRGGWNCGHELIPVSEVQVPQALREKFKNLNNNAEIDKLSELIPDAKKYVGEFGLEKVQAVFDAVKNKIASWKNLTLEKQVDKAFYEMDWVESHQKYDTWKVAKVAYEKQYQKIGYQIAKSKIEADSTYALGYAEKTKSADLKQYAEKFKEMLKSDVSISELQDYAKALNSKIEKLEVAKLKRNSIKISNIDESKYTQERKDNAFWEKSSANNADKQFRKETENVWKNASELEKISATKYTGGSGSYNRPLRGFEDDWYDYKGVGKVDLNREGSAENIKAFTSLLNRSISKRDVWVMRGIETKQGTSNFLGIGINTAKLREMSNSQLQSFVGKTVTDEGFISCGTMKGTGFSGDILNIYCPKGTKMIYAEPFSEYNGDSLNAYNNLWDGKTKYSFRKEFETILQRGTSFRIIKIEGNGNGQLYIDVEVVGQI